MFQTTRIPMVLAKANLRIVKDDKGVEHRVALVALVVDPFPVERARELGEDIAAHLFDDRDQIRPEFVKSVLDTRTPQQMLHVLSAPDMKEAVAKLRHVDVLAFAVTLETDKDGEDRWLKATVQVRLGIAEREHREFLAQKFGDKVWVTWSPEQHPLPLEGEAKD